MPTVPYSSVPHVNPEPLRAPSLSPNAPATAFGGGVAAEAGTFGDLSGAVNAAQRIADEQQRIRLEEKARADQIAVTDAGGQIAQYRNHALYDPDKGWLNQKGRNAAGVPDKAREEYWDVSNVIRANLHSDDQRAAYDRIATSEWDQMDGQIQQHVAKERMAYDNQATQSALDAQQTKAIQGYDDPMVVEPAIQARAAIIEQHGQRNGLPPEFTKQAIAEATSATRFDVLQQMVNAGDDLSASAYFTKYRDQFVGKNLTQAETLVNHSSAEGAAQRQSDTIVQTATGLMEALKQAATIQNPQVRDKTEQRIRRYYEDVQAAERQDRSQARERLGQLLEQSGGNLDAITKSPDWVLKLNDTDRTALEHRSQQIRNPVVRSNQALVAHWRQMSALNDSTRAQFLAEDFTSPKYSQSLSESDRNWFIARQAALRGGAGPTGKIDKSLYRKQESLIVKQSKDAESKRNAAAVMEKASPGSSKYLPPPPTITIPKWMTDSAAHNPDYRNYLKSAGVVLPDDTGAPQPSAPRVPGAPIQKPNGARP